MPSTHTSTSRILDTVDTTSRARTAFSRRRRVARDVGAKRMLVHGERDSDLDLDAFRIQTEHLQDASAARGLAPSDSHRRIAFCTHRNASGKKEPLRFRAELDIEAVAVEERCEHVPSRSRLAQIDV